MKIAKNDYLKPTPIDAHCSDGELSMQIATATTNGQPSPNELCLLLELADEQAIPIIFDKAQAVKLIKQLQSIVQVL